MIDLRKHRLVCGLFIATSLFSCTKSELEIEGEEYPARTILAYISADNNLWDAVGYNLKDMASGLSGHPNCNILAFVDGPGIKSYFLNIHDGRMETVFTFNATNVKDFDPQIDKNQDGNLDSSNPATLKMAIDFMLERFPGREYSLILWSHGGGWIPFDNYSRLFDSYIQRINYSSVYSLNGLPMVTKDALPSRFFSEESRQTMELDGLVDAIPDHMFDFILFDACYMGCVEVAYALRDKSRYFISSTTEIMGTGFPYKSIVGKMANGYLMGICRDFYTYYNKYDNYCRLGEVSLVRTDGLDSLANCFRKIVSDKPDVRRKDTLYSNIQDFDRIRNNNEDHSVFYDLNAVARTYSKLKSGSDYSEFKAQLDRCVLYAASTPELFIYNPVVDFQVADHVTVNEFSGLSVYIPFKDYDSFGLNAQYAQTEWSKATNYK